MDKIKEQMKKMGESKNLLIILYILGILIIAKIIFLAGVVVGFHKASFGHAWEEHYNENFGMGHRNINMGGMEKWGMMDYFPNAHGSTGKIIKIELPNIFVQDRDDTEKVILLGSDTKIEKERADITPEGLRINDFIVAIGTPNEQGVIEAKLIRIIPRPEFLKE